LHRAYWQRFRLPKLAKLAKCDVLFVPGGMDNSGFHPLVTMSRNMLPFDSGLLPAVRAFIDFVAERMPPMI
jgi:hypothetical protein